MESSIKRSFIIGDEWLYYKIYTGYKVSDSILLSSLKTTIESLIEKKIIDKWFFIRYADPDYHLRIRFHVKSEKQLMVIINELNSSLKGYIESGIIWKLQLDTYNRELERYGNNTIILAENIFFKDSKMVLDLIEIIDEKNHEEIRWLIALKVIDHYLKIFNLNSYQRLEFVKNMRHGYSNYYISESKTIVSQLNLKYSVKKQIIKLFLEENLFQDIKQDSIKKTIESNIKHDNISINEIIKLHESNALEVQLSDLLSSYIHMHLNRLFKTRNTLNEFICYDYLYRYYMSKEKGAF